jgi:hypothetical protein
MSWINTEGKSRARDLRSSRTALLSEVQMGRSLPQQDIFDAIDRRCNAERERIEAERDLAKAVISWLGHQAEKAGAIETSREIAPAQGEKLLTLSELAARMGRDPRTIQEWEKDFGLPSLRAHSTADPLFDWREVLEWMRRHRKINHTEGRGNGKLASQAPIGTRPQATQRRS